ncbi:ABC transporter substrate-binding protein [Streptomyces boninensis]|uniref:ABC transporter substrate-binding protein n=1 Tax=Streptomyces boninensis TaxID=2039455 RepID=UPI003B218AB9
MPAALLLLALTAAGCGDDDSGDPKSAKGLEKTTLNVGTMPIVDDAGVQLAIDRGLFKAEGLTVKTRMVKGGAEAVPALKGGALDLSFGGYTTWFAAQSQKVMDLKIVADSYSMRPGVLVLAVPKNSPVKSPKDLAGKKIAVNVKRNLASLLTRTALAPHGVEVNEEKNTVEVPYPQMEAALKNGSVDAAFMPEPFISQAAKNIGARPVVDFGKGPTATAPIAGYAATAGFAAENPKTVAAFQRAINKAQKLLAKPAVRKDIIPKYTEIPAAMVPKLTYGVFPTDLDAARLKPMNDMMLRQGYLKQPLAIDPLLVKE